MKEDMNRKIAARVTEELKKRNMEGFYCENAEEAVNLILDMMEPEALISWGGSASVKEIGLLERLKETGHNLLEYPEEDRKAIGSPVFSQVVGCDYFLMGANAITLKGELVNIDGASNRLSCLLHGPKHVILVAGMNKIVKTAEDGIHRIQTSVCPYIADTTNRKTPCAVTGVCTDCQSPDCMCCNIVITRRSRYTGRIKVILVGEPLGI